MLNTMLKKLKKIWSKKWFRYSLIGSLALLLILELIARFVLGLGATPVYIENEYYEYIYAPNQNVSRFGNQIQTNKWSMRSKEISKNDKHTTLLIGDSVVNGGPHVDQSDLASTKLEDDLKSKYPGTRVLNISAGSWGPDNAFAYINEHGDFNASQIILVFSSHDYNDNMHHRKVVGVHKSWPDSQPFMAITDGWSKYALPRIKSFFGVKNNEYDYLIGHDDSKVNSGWNNFIQYCRKEKIDLLVYVHPEVEELKAKKFQNKGVNLLELLNIRNVEVINGLSLDHKLSEYRDNIHLNAEGHQRLYEILRPSIESHIKAEM